MDYSSCAGATHKAKSLNERETPQMPIDALIIGLIVLLISCSACFYLYMRLTFAERKTAMMESLVLDLKMAMDQILMAGVGGGGSPAPISHVAAPEQISAEQIPEDTFYSSVLEQAHEDTDENQVAEEGVSLDKVMQGFSETEPVTAPMEEELNLDEMTKADLLALAEKRGLRAKRASTREQLLTLLRRPSPLQNSGLTTGTENVSGSLGSGFQDGASLDGSINVDLGQGGASLE